MKNNLTMMYSYKLSIFLREFLFGFLRGNLETLFSKLCVWYGGQMFIVFFIYTFLILRHTYSFTIARKIINQNEVSEVYKCCTVIGK